MALSIPSGPAEISRNELTPRAALKRAWVWYLVMLLVPFLLFVTVVVTLMESTNPRHMTMMDAWFLGSIGFLILAAPAAFALRSRYFRPYWRGEVVSPRSYLTGMLIVWSAFEAGGIISLLGCLAGHSLLPCLIPALASFMFFTPLWPNGRAMVKRTGNADDPEIYAEPR
ncbi:MAG: hypothetical protein JWN51_3671 [Phycisphaerales bacterium]|nr:hypothetical protein [Phycisphaerales bacterium]